jgi:hypothetical protein
MTRDEARIELRALSRPFRDRAVEVFEVPDIQDAIHLHTIYRDIPTYEDLAALVDEAGWSVFLPLTIVFREKP